MVALVECRQGENYGVHRQYVNPVPASVLQMIGYDIMYSKGEGRYLFDPDEQRYLDFLGGRDAFHLGRNRPHARRVIHETPEWCTPNVVQMDWPPLSGLLAEALVERLGETQPEHHRSDPSGEGRNRRVNEDCQGRQDPDGEGKADL